MVATFPSIGEYDGFEPWSDDIADEWFTNAGRLPCPECGSMTEVCGYDADFRPYTHVTAHVD